MKLNTRSLRGALAALLCLCLFAALIPVSLAAQSGDYRDPVDHWIISNNRTNELDANSITTHETFHCYVCNMRTSFVVFRTPEYTRDGASAMTRNVFFAEGTTFDGKNTERINDGIPGVDATYTGFHWTKAVCETCGTLNSNVGSEYAVGKDLYVLSDCAAAFMQDLGDAVSYEYADSQRHTKTVKSGQYSVF